MSMESGLEPAPKAENGGVFLIDLTPFCFCCSGKPMQITIRKVTRFGRDDYFIAEPEHAAWFEKLTRRRNVTKVDVEVLEMLGVRCVVPSTVVFFDYDGPLPVPALHYWDAPQKAHPLSNRGAL